MEEAKYYKLAMSAQLLVNRIWQHLQKKTKLIWSNNTNPGFVSEAVAKIVKFPVADLANPRS